MASRAIAKAVIRADNRKLGGDLRKSRRMFSKSFKGIGGGIKGALSGALSPLGVGVGALGFAAVGREVLDFEKTLTDIEIQGDATSDTMDGLRNTIDDLAKTNAMGKGELAGLALEMVNLEGKAGLNAEKLKVLGDAAFATSAPVQELAGLSLALGNSFGLVDAEGLRKGLDGIVTAGKEGSIPLNEMNLLLQQNGASFAKFAETGARGAGRMAAVLQALRKDAGSAGEAGTRLGSILGIFQTRELELRKAGIEVRSLAGGYRKFGDIIKQIDNSGLVRNAEKFKKAFGVRKEARLALDSLLHRQALIESITDATRKGGTIEADVARRRDSDSFKIAEAFNDIKLTIIKAFTPERIKKFASAMKTVAKVVGYIADHITAFVTLLAAVKISSFVTGMQAAAASSGVMTKNMALANGTMGKLGAGANLIGAAMAGWTVGTAIDEWTGASDKLSDWLARPSEKEKRLTDSGHLRDLAAIVGKQAKKAQGFTFAGSDGKAEAGFDQGRALSRSLRLAGEARRSGLLGKNGTVNREAAFTAQTGRASFKFTPAMHQQDLNSHGTPELVSAIRQALAIEKVANQATAAGLNITITVDEKGLLKAEAVRDAASRRSPQ